MATGYQPPNNAMKLTRGGLEANRGMVTAGRHGLAATRDQGSRVRPSQLIASVRQAGASARVDRGTNWRPSGTNRRPGIVPVELRVGKGTPAPESWQQGLAGHGESGAGSMGTDSRRATLW